ncbi:hypothetical protein [Methanothermobacter sp.]|uniref:hypothetical protein n=1 Tax=Methanothermobacter sp. TaxID=1884223 RepID=UPI003C719F94
MKGRSCAGDLKMKDVIDEFRRAAGKSFRELRRVLDEKYCWKCPQRSTRDRIGCREVEAWMRLTSTLEEELTEQVKGLGENYHEHVLLRIRDRTERATIKIIRDRGGYMIIREGTSGIRMGHEVMVGSRILRVEGMDGAAVITDGGRYPLYEVQGRVLDRVRTGHPFYRYIMSLEGQDE